MPATMSQLQRWYNEGETKGATHMIVRCDSFEYRGDPGDSCCYPVYVIPGEDVREKAAEGGDRLMEVYSYRVGRERQFGTRARVFNYD